MDWNNDADWKQYVKILRTHIKGLGYNLFFIRPDKGCRSIYQNEVDFINKTIKISDNHCFEYKVYVILHEIGHIILNKNKDNFSKTCGYGQEYFGSRTNTNKLSVIEEEFKAWETGFKLSKKLKFKIDRRRFEIFKSTCLVSYIIKYFKD
jgi:hypothetical protein